MTLDINLETSSLSHSDGRVKPRCPFLLAGLSSGQHLCLQFLHASLQGLLPPKGHFALPALGHLLPSQPNLLLLEEVSATPVASLGRAGQLLEMGRQGNSKWQKVRKLSHRSDHLLLVERTIEGQANKKTKGWLAQLPNAHFFW